MTEMRRKDRQITDHREIDAILQNCDTCRLGLTDNGQPYVVPVSYGFSREGDAVTLYFHCAGEGRKLRILRENPALCAEVSRPLGLITGEAACRHGMGFESVIGWGNARFLEEEGEKKNALSHIMRHYTGRDWDEFDPAVLKHTTVFAVTFDTLTAKCRPMPQK